MVYTSQHGQATEWRKLYDNYFDKNFMSDQSNEEIWHAIYNVSDAEIWNTRMALKKKLVAYIREKFTQTWLKNQGDPARVVSLLERINPNAFDDWFLPSFQLHTSVLTCSSPTWSACLRSLTILSTQYCSSSQVRLTQLMVQVRA